jgi:hypothetical protein
LLKWMGGVRGGGFDLIETIPEGLRGKALGRESPEAVEDAVAIPVGDFGFGSWLADPMDGGEEEVVRGGGAGGRSGPEGARAAKAPGRQNSMEVAERGTGAVASLMRAATRSAVPRQVWWTMRGLPSTRALSTM